MKYIPDWVQNLHDEENKELLLQIIAVDSGPLETPREMNFAIKEVASQEHATALQLSIAQQGWHVDVVEDVSDSKLFWVEAQKTDYVISEQGLEGDEHFFESLAQKYHATYDGWYAAVV
jgi:hypothetical protein